MNSKTVDLNPERWARVEALFDQAVEMQPGERNDFLADACADDAELRGYLRSLLSTDIADDALVADMISGALREAAPKLFDQPRNFQGERIGPYRLVRLIGTGGMGAVYLAERADEQFQREVAIKLVRHRLVDPQIEDRLKAERQILANLDHPNIARLLDGGTTNDGTPYLVMEYINGLPVDEYCDRHQLDIDARLELFRTICAAVHYAHQNLIVHRDIKPSNILVSEDGTTKLLDFGIAKLIDASGMATDGLTREGVALMTPENAAPEQVLGKPVTTATDTYALGVLLHRLLTGYSPLPTDNLSPREIAYLICEQTIERPSSIIEQKQADMRHGRQDSSLVDLADICERRKISADRLQRRLRGDLDNILLTALRKEPERRYNSVSEFSEDIRMHRQSMPVIARPDTWNYRTGKFVRRHFAGVASSIVLVLLLISFGVVTQVQNQRIAEERDTARQVSTFLEEIFMEPDPARARGLDITAKEILANGAEKIHRQLEDRPEIQSDLMETIGRVYLNLGEYEQSVAMHEESLALRRDALGERHAKVAQSQNELAVSLTRQGNFQRALQLLETARETNQRNFGEDSVEVATNYQNLAELHLAMSDLDAAEAAARRSITTYAHLNNELPLSYAESISLLARILQVKGDLDQTEQLLREAIDIVQTQVGSDHPYMAYFLQNLAVLLKSKGEIDDAEAMFHESISATRRILGNEHDLLGTSLVMLGSLLHEKGDFPGAEAALRDAIVIHQNARGASHPFVAYDMTSLGMLLHDMGELDAAEKMLRDALTKYELSLDPAHQYIGSTLTELGAVLNTAGMAEQAVPILQRAIEIRRRDYPDDHPLVAGSNVVYGDTLGRLGRYEEAEDILLKNYELLEGANDRRARTARQAIIRLYEAWGKPEIAVRYQR